MTVIIRLQNLPWSANAADIREFFKGLYIPEGGVHIVGGEMGDAFIAFSSDEDARLAMRKTANPLKGIQVTLLLSSGTEMQKVIEVAQQQSRVLRGFAPSSAPPQAPPPTAPAQQPLAVHDQSRVSPARDPYSAAPPTNAAPYPVNSNHSDPYPGQNFSSYGRPPANFDSSQYPKVAENRWPPQNSVAPTNPPPTNDKPPSQEPNYYNQPPSNQAHYQPQPSQHPPKPTGDKSHDNEPRVGGGFGGQHPMNNLLPERGPLPDITNPLERGQYPPVDSRRLPGDPMVGPFANAPRDAQAFNYHEERGQFKGNDAHNLHPANYGRPDPNSFKNGHPEHRASPANYPPQTQQQPPHFNNFAQPPTVPNNFGDNLDKNSALPPGGVRDTPINSAMPGQTLQQPTVPPRSGPKETPAAVPTKETSSEKISSTNSSSGRDRDRRDSRNKDDRRQRSRSRDRDRDRDRRRRYRSRSRSRDRGSRRRRSRSRERGRSDYERRDRDRRDRDRYSSRRSERNSAEENRKPEEKDKTTESPTAAKPNSNASVVGLNKSSSAGQLPNIGSGPVVPDKREARAFPSGPILSTPSFVASSTTTSAGGIPGLGEIPKDIPKEGLSICAPVVTEQIKTSDNNLNSDWRRPPAQRESQPPPKSSTMPPPLEPMMMPQVQPTPLLGNPPRPHFNDSLPPVPGNNPMGNVANSGMMAPRPNGPGMMPPGPNGPGMMPPGPSGPRMMPPGPSGPGMMPPAPNGPGMMPPAPQNMNNSEIRKPGHPFPPAKEPLLPLPTPDRHDSMRRPIDVGMDGAPGMFPDRNGPPQNDWQGNHPGGDPMNNPPFMDAEMPMDDPNMWNNSDGMGPGPGPNDFNDPGPPPFGFRGRGEPRTGVMNRLGRGNGPEPQRGFDPDMGARMDDQESSRGRGGMPYARGRGRGGFQSDFGGNKKFKTRCVELLHVPHNAGYKYIRDFFTGIYMTSNSIKIIGDENGKRIGVALVQFGRTRDALEAFKRSGNYILDSRITVNFIDEGFYHDSLDINGPRMDSGGPRPLFDTPVYDEPPMGPGLEPMPPTRCLYVRGLPVGCTDHNVANVFDNFQVLNVVLEFEPGSRLPTGGCFVRMASEKEAESALMELRDPNIDGSPIDIMPCPEDSVIATEKNNEKIYRPANSAAPKSGERARDGDAKTGSKPDDLLTDSVVISSVKADVTEMNVRDFLSDEGLMPESVHLARPKSDGKREVFVVFAKISDAKRAVGKDGQKIGSSKVKVSLISKPTVMSEMGLPFNPLDLFKKSQQENVGGDVGAPKKKDNERRSPSKVSRSRPEVSNKVGAPPPLGHRVAVAPNGNVIKSNTLEPPSDFGSPGCVVALSNVPFSATTDDLLVFFRDFPGLGPDNVIRRYDERNRPTSDARVALCNREDARRAVDRLNRKFIGQRPIFLRLVE